MRLLPEGGGRRTLALLPLLAIPILLGLVLAAYAGSEAADPARVEAGDRVQVNVQVFDLRGRLLYSTRVADLPELEQVKADFGGAFEVPSLTVDSPMGLNVTGDLRPLPLDNTSSIVVGDQLVGKPIGHRIAVPVLGGFEGYVEPITIERTRGPFNLTMRGSNALLANVTTTDEEGYLAFDDVLRARAVERGATWTAIRFDVEPGDMLRVNQTNFTAEVTRVDSPEQFGLYFHTEVGHEFTVRSSCAFAGSLLPSGSYRVVSVDETTIGLERAPTRWPQLIGRQVVMVIEVAAIVEEEATA